MVAIRELIERFVRWQRTPARVAPMSQTQRECLNCGESYDGDYCPRCGQSGSMGRLTPRNLMTNALDVWGAGNRSMPRAIWHLLARPGYMIADYLRGHRQPYFPPFKMLFILTATFLLLVETVRWGSGYVVDDRHDMVRELLDKAMTSNVVKDNADVYTPEQLERFMMQKNLIIGLTRRCWVWLADHRAISIVLTQVFVALGVWLFFRRSPLGTRLALSEQVFVQVLISSQMMVLSIIVFLVTLPLVPGGEENLPNWLMWGAYVVDYKQIFGYSWWGTIWRAVAVMASLILALMLVLFIGVVVIALPLAL